MDLIFPAQMIKEPLIYEMSKKFPVIFNIRRAHVTAKVGEMVLQLEADDEVLDEAEKWLRSKGLEVKSISRDSLES